jgi:hypothetical protein
MTIVLMLGSGPNVLLARDMPRSAFHSIVTINNAWRVRPDWDYLVHPEDFPTDRRPATPGSGQTVITAAQFVPAQNAYGGFVYAGGTMAFTASYWALHALRPSVIAYLGCDMVYPTDRPTHFYGTGSPDPLRADVTLRSLEAKSARLQVMAAAQGCALVNLSDETSRLVFPRAALADLPYVSPQDFHPRAVALAQKAEAERGYFVPSGRYWEEAARFDPTALDRIDTLWRRAAAVRSVPLCGKAA